MQKAAHLISFNTVFLLVILLIPCRVLAFGGYGPGEEEPVVPPPIVSVPEQPTEDEQVQTDQVQTDQVQTESSAQVQDSASVSDPKTTAAIDESDDTKSAVNDAGSTTQAEQKKEQKAKKRAARKSARKAKMMQKIEHNSKTVFWSTLGGSAVAACGIGVLSLVSPLCLACPLAGPAGLIGMAVGTGAGLVFAQDWDGGRIFGTLALSALIGGILGVTAGIASLMVVNIAAGSLVGGAPIYDPGRANSINTASLVVAGLASAGIMMGGGTLGSWAVSALHRGMAEEDLKTRMHKHKRKRRCHSRKKTSAPPTSMAY